MRHQEVRAFSKTLPCPEENIAVLDLLNQPITKAALADVDVVLLGGSGDYSAIGSEPWLLRTLDGLRLLRDQRMPVFASCWGFQAFARAMGGEVERDEDRGEVGTLEITLTPAGRQDPVFGGLPGQFFAAMGHMDHVTKLPEGAVRLASSERSVNQAYKFLDCPIYATQFHPELRREDLLERLQQYPEYVKGVDGMSFEHFERQLRDTSDCTRLLPRFLETLG